MGALDSVSVLLLLAVISTGKNFGHLLCEVLGLARY
jgi:hypothetical protein